MHWNNWNQYDNHHAGRHGTERVALRGVRYYDSHTVAPERVEYNHLYPYLGHGFRCEGRRGFILGEPILIYQAPNFQSPAVDTKTGFVYRIHAEMAGGGRRCAIYDSGADSDRHRSGAAGADDL